MNTKCHKCDKTFEEAISKNIYFTRVNEKGVEGIWECRPSCDHGFDNQEEALLNALEKNEKDK